MAGFLNFVAALLLTILPALRPCDCHGFSFVCMCALAAPSSAPSAEQKDAPVTCCCCGHAKSKARTHSSVKADDSLAQNRKPGLPASRKPESCLKFMAQETGAAVLISFGEPMVLIPLCASLYPAMGAVQRQVGPSRLQAERPPPLGLIFAEIKVIRI